MRKYLIIILVCCASCWLKAAPQPLSACAEIQLLTCTPGNAVWSKYGHTGIRVLDKDQNLDIVFNYGIFDLTADDFYIKFLRGETYYQLGIEPYPYFEKFYRHFGRKTYWQELNLTQSQKQQVFDALLTNYQPENRFYLYNFVFDNCATRPYYLIKHALGDSIISNYKGFSGVDFRQAISHYTGKNSWVDFGINLIFGSEANVAMTNEERLFLPEELMNYMAQAELADGTKLVKKQQIEAFPAAQVTWYANCWLGIGLFAIVLLAISLIDRRRHKLSWGVDVVLIILYLILTSIVVYMTFYSCHPLVGFNWRLILLPIIHLCSRLVYILR